eukprot:CAMPEP_0202881318 /NCGR_PEP_ID=MMETSP1391-20130828/36368_1 /ASSEMBLY_ACC=CAM_ASM_000867 /TAXON_ID=1034604 /ORGANISM="Chlamydomonas leiostraca, Strain SAG 11-49" /LENGTH=49 /DNA_ID= /DNA_START= /DNA_END= /DNA_ORIENTATION=
MAMLSQLWRQLVRLGAAGKNTDELKLQQLGYKQELRREFTLLNNLGASV